MTIAKIRELYSCVESVEKVNNEYVCVLDDGVIIKGRILKDVESQLKERKEDNIMDVNMFREVLDEIESDNTLESNEIDRERAREIANEWKAMKEQIKVDREQRKEIAQQEGLLSNEIYQVCNCSDRVVIYESTTKKDISEFLGRKSSITPTTIEMIRQVGVNHEYYVEVDWVSDSEFVEIKENNLLLEA